MDNILLEISRLACFYSVDIYKKQSRKKRRIWRIQNSSFVCFSTTSIFSRWRLTTWTWSKVNKFFSLENNQNQSDRLRRSRSRFFTSAEIVLICMKLQNPLRMHSPCSYCRQLASLKSVTGLNNDESSRKIQREDYRP